MGVNASTCFETFPRKKEIIKFVEEVRCFLFPGYFEKLNGNINKF